VTYFLLGLTKVISQPESTKMPIKHFYLQGDDISTAKPVALDELLDLNGLQCLIAAHFAIVQPKGIFLEPILK
jgi:hypothetical protein